jgi:cytosine/adenosine deaminase-related metal-dependent hydrolase
MASTLNAISSNNVVLENEVIVATIVFDSATGKIIHIIRKDSTGATEEAESATGDESDSDASEYYDQELQALGVSPENHRNIEDLVLLPGIVDAHVHLNEVSYYPPFFILFYFIFAFWLLGKFRREIHAVISGCCTLCLL